LSREVESYDGFPMGMLLEQVELPRERPGQPSRRAGMALSDPFTETVARMDTILGIDRQPAEGPVAEMGAEGAIAGPPASPVGLRPEL
jgi:hypothetical protein